MLEEKELGHAKSLMKRSNQLIIIAVLIGLIYIAAGIVLAFANQAFDGYQKWPLIILLQELNRVICNGVGCISRLFVNLPCPNHAVIVKRCRVATLLRKPIRESQLRMKIVSQMPLAG